MQNRETARPRRRRHTDRHANRPSALITLPVIIMVLLAVQRQLIRGLTIGGLKG